MLHVVDETSPLFHETPESLAAAGVEFNVSVSGLDDTWMQTVVAEHRYGHSRIAWGHRHADALSEQGNALTLDLRKFNGSRPGKPTPHFPYPRSTRAHASDGRVFYPKRGDRFVSG